MILITGASGLLGQALVRHLLLNGYSVRLLLRDIDSPGFEGLQVERVHGNVLDNDSLDKACAGVEVIYHTAMLPSNIPGMFDELFKVNVLGTQNVIDAARRAGTKKLMFISNYTALISKHMSNQVITENNLYEIAEGISSYSKTMAMACQQLESAHGNQLETLVLLPSYQMGPFDYKLSLIGHFMWDYARGRVPFLTDGGFEMSDSRDVAAVAVSLVEKGISGEKFLYSNGYLRVKEFMHWIEALSGIDAPRSFLPKFILYPAAWFLEYKYKAKGEYPIFNRFMLDMLSRQIRIDTSKIVEKLSITPRNWESVFSDSYNWLAGHYHLVQVKKNQNA